MHTFGGFARAPTRTPRDSLPLKTVSYSLTLRSLRFYPSLNPSPRCGEGLQVFCSLSVNSVEGLGGRV